MFSLNVPGVQGTEVGFEQVLDTFDTNHGGGETDWYSREALIQANERSHHWRAVDLKDSTVVRNIRLPNHLHFEERHEPRLIPTTLPVTEAAARLAELLPNYASSHPRCWASIEYHLTHEPDPIYLIEGEPLIPDQYRGVERGEQELFHLDGLHRLLSLELAGKLTAEHLGQVPLKAFIASN